MMFKRLMSTVLLALFLLANVSCQSTASEPVTISISGAFALFPMVTVWAEQYKQSHPNVQFDIQAGGAGKGMTDVLSGAVDVAMLSREVRPEEVEQGAVLVPVTIDAVVPVVNADNPYLDLLLAQGITGEDVQKIWLSQADLTWGDLLGGEATEKINRYTRSDSSGAAEMWAKFGGGKAQEELFGIAVNGDPGLAEAVRQDKLGFGYNNIGFAYDNKTGAVNAGLVVVPIDLNGDGTITPNENFYNNRATLIEAVAAEVYPYPPARVLYLVTKGEPNPEIISFYKWILADGQAFVNDAGYVQLSPARLQEAVAALE